MTHSNFDRQLILENYRNPYNFSVPTSYDFSGESINWSCGDELKCYLKFKGELDEHQKDSTKTVEKLYFSGRGCALSIAAASIIARELEGKKISEISDIPNNFIEQFIGSDFSINREKCVRLSYQALQEALSNFID